MTKPQASTFPKYCKDNPKKFDIKYKYYTRSLQQTVGQNAFFYIISHFKR
jgi:hypothetical protein